MSSESIELAASPINSMVKRSTEHGTLSPLESWNTRESLLRWIIASFLQFLHCIDEVSRLVKPPIDAGKPHVGHLVEVAQALHHTLADRHARHLVFVARRDLVGDAVHDFLNGLMADGPLLARALDAVEELFAREQLAAAVALDDHQPRVFDLFVGREAKTAAQAFAPTADGRPLLRTPGVDDFVFLLAALRATHSTPNTFGSGWRCRSTPNIGESRNRRGKFDVPGPKRDGSSEEQERGCAKADVDEEVDALPRLRLSECASPAPRPPR